MPESQRAGMAGQRPPTAIPSQHHRQPRALRAGGVLQTRTPRFRAVLTGAFQRSGSGLSLSWSAPARIPILIDEKVSDRGGNHGRRALEHHHLRTESRRAG